MELRHLRYFIAVAEELNLRRAAARLNVSHPPLSRQIGDLEREIGAKLLDRTGRSLTLTEAGRLFLDEARQVISRARGAAELARSASRGEAGRLRIAYASGYFEPGLAKIMNRFRQCYPAISLHIEQLSPPLQVEALQHERIDLGYLGLRFSHAVADLAFQCVRTASIRVALPTDHRLAERATIALDALANEPFIALTDTFPRYQAWLVRHCETAGFRPMIAHAVDTASGLFGLVSAGFGVALMPDLHDPPSCEVAHRPLDPDLPEVEFNVAWRRDNAAPSLGNFLTMLRETAAGEMMPAQAAVALFY